MNWTERINAAVAYIEANLEGEFDGEKLGRIAGCSLYNFQRLFSYIADKPLSQYIRERRLTLAAFDILRTDERLIDIALRYGYESQDAFTRAFRQYHGVLPSVARREPSQLKSCPRIVFHATEQEETEMNYRIEAWPAFTIAGFRVPMKTDEAFDRVPQLWKDVWQDGRIGALHALFQQADYRPEGFLGVAAGGKWGANEDMDYYVAVTTHVDAEGVKRVPTPEGMAELSLPAATWAIIEANGDPFEVIQPLYKRFFAEWLPASGYRLADVPAIESYMMDNRQNIWIAVEKEA